MFGVYNNNYVSLFVCLLQLYDSREADDHFWTFSYSSLTMHYPYSYCVRVSPAMANRMVDSARSVLNNYLPDVYIYTDTVKGAEAGKYVQNRSFSP